jgi:hypothetical protein
MVPLVDCLQAEEVGCGTRGGDGSFRALPDRGHVIVNSVGGSP